MQPLVIGFSEVIMALDDSISGHSLFSARPGDPADLVLFSKRLAISRPGRTWSWLLRST
jgi:hypothetical protein